MKQLGKLLVFVAIIAAIVVVGFWPARNDPPPATLPNWFHHLRTLEVKLSRAETALDSEDETAAMVFVRQAREQCEALVAEIEADHAEWIEHLLAE